MIKQLVVKYFDQKIKDFFKERSNVINFILNHERKNLCIDRLCTAIKETEAVSTKLKHDDIKQLAENYAIIFAESALKLLEEQILSQTARLQVEKEYREAHEKIEELNNAGDANIEYSHIQ